MNACPKCGKNLALVGRIHNCVATPGISTSAKPIVNKAPVAKQVDAEDLKSSAVRRAGSKPAGGTNSRVAQGQSERAPYKREVEGATPSTATKSRARSSTDRALDFDSKGVGSTPAASANPTPRSQIEMASRKKKPDYYREYQREYQRKRRAKLKAKKDAYPRSGI